MGAVERRKGEGEKGGKDRGREGGREGERLFICDASLICVFLCLYFTLPYMCV